MDAVPMGMPNDVLIVEDDAIIALDFEDTILGFGVEAVRSASNVARALQLIDDRAPDFALLDVGLASEKSFAVAERLQAMNIPFVFISGYGSRVVLPPATNSFSSAHFDTITSTQGQEYSRTSEFSNVRGSFLGFASVLLAAVG